MKRVSENLGSLIFGCMYEQNIGSETVGWIVINHKPKT